MFLNILGKKISKIDLTEASPVVTDVVTGLSGPWCVVAHGYDLYIAEYTAGKIIKYSLLSSAKALEKDKGIAVYPNPASEHIQLSGLTKKTN